MIKQIWVGWKSLCRYELVTFCVWVFTILVFLIYAIKDNDFFGWFRYGTMFAIFFTRYLSIWIEHKDAQAHKSVGDKNG